MGVPQLAAFGVRVRHRDTDHEHESGLDHVPQRKPDQLELADPFPVSGMERERLHDRAIRVMCGDLGETESCGGEAEHHDTAIRIEREEAFRFWRIRKSGVFLSAQDAENRNFSLVITLSIGGLVNCAIAERALAKRSKEDTL